MTQAASNALTHQLTQQPPAQRAVRVVTDPIAVLDTARFEHMQRIANVMAHSNLIPNALCFEKDGDRLVPLPIEVVTANCFLVVNQAVRWEMDPFAVAQCVSVVHGKLCYEGKLIAAVIKARLGYDLEYDITGEGEQMHVVVTATLNGNPVLDSKNRAKIATGTVAEWQTDGKGSPWAARGGRPRMLRYRGAREWCRIHEPGLMLGVYGDDEMEEMNARFAAARVVNDVTRELPAAANDGPPVPGEETIGGEVVENNASPPPEEDQPPVPAVEQQATVSDFPGDRPMRSDPPMPTDDGLEIPPYLRRSDKPKFSADEEEWFESLEGEFKLCATPDALYESKRSLMLPWEGQVAKAAWEEATAIHDRHLARIKAKG